MTKRGTSPVGLIIVGALLFAACGGGSDAEPAETDDVEDTQPDDTEPPDTEPNDDTTDPVTTDSNDFASSGRCAVVQEDGSYEPIDCGQPHDSEFVVTVGVPAGDPLDDETEESVRLTQPCVESVNTFLGRSTSMFGIDVGIDADLDAGTIDCWAEATAEESLVGSIEEIGLLEALGEFRMLPDLEPGTCFVNADDDSFDLVFEANCDEPAAEQLFAFVTLDDRDYPGEDAVVDEAFEKCDVELASTSLTLISEAYSIVFPEEPGWTAMNQRTVSCSAFREGEAVDESATEPNGEALWVAPASFEWGVDAPICMNQVDDGNDEDNFVEWTEVDCAGPHETEFLGFAESPFITLPDDIDEATAGLRDACNPLLEAQTGQARELPGLDLNFRAPADLGEPVDGPIECMASISDPFLVGSLQTADIDTVLGDIVVLADLVPGTCFTFPGESFSLGLVVSCDEAEAILAVGTYVMPEYGIYPETDELRTERTRVCTEIYSTSGLSGDPATLSGTFASRTEYLFDGERVATCDITPV